MASLIDKSYPESMERDFKRRRYKTLGDAITRMDILCDLNTEFGGDIDKKRAYLYNIYQKYLDDFVKNRKLREEVRNQIAKDSIVSLVEESNKHFVRCLRAILLAIALGIFNQFKFDLGIKAFLSVPHFILYSYIIYNNSKSSKIDKLADQKKQETYDNIKDADIDKVLYVEASIKAKEHFGCTKEEYAERYIKEAEKELEEWIRIWGHRYAALYKMSTRRLWMDIYKEYSSTW